MTADEKTCPDCAETIKGAAKVCRYCGYRFDDAADDDRPASSGNIPAPSPEKGFFARTFSLNTGTKSDPAVDADTYWQAAPKTDGTGRTIAISVFVAAIIVTLAVFAFHRPQSHGRQAADTSLTSDPDAVEPANIDSANDEIGESFDAEIAAERNLKAGIKDADSAKFRNEFVSRLPGGNMMLCGEVNSKNGFGAYTGFKRFIASPNPDAPNLIEGETTAVGDGSDDVFRQAYQAACGNPIKRLD